MILYKNNIYIFAKNEKEIETLRQTIRIYDHDLGMEFGIKKCTILKMNKGKRETMEEIKLTNQERNRIKICPRKLKCIKFSRILRYKWITQSQSEDQT